MAGAGEVLEQIRLWIPVGGGLLGATAGLFGAVWGRRSLHLQRAREDRDAAEARQGQASRVAAWLSEERTEYMNRVDIRWCLNVANASQIPVYELHAWVGHPQVGTTDVQVGAAQVLPQRDTVVALSLEDTERLRVSNPPRWEGARVIEAGRYRTPSEFRLRVAFRDAAGRWWLRDERGSLQETAEPAWEDDAFGDEK